MEFAKADCINFLVSLKDGIGALNKNNNNNNKALYYVRPWFVVKDVS